MADATVSRLYSALVHEDDDDSCPDLAEDACRDVPANAGKLIGAFTLTKVGDRIVDPKTTLPWLLSAVGAPSFALGLLVPVREAGSLLPQAGLLGWVRRFEQRRFVWIIGAIGQAVAALMIGGAAAMWSGSAAAVAILVGLGIFALSRSLSSMSAKDVIGKTIPKGKRGTITGAAASISGVIAIIAGALVGLLGSGTDASILAVVVAGAALLWGTAAALFRWITEHPSTDTTTGGGIEHIREVLASDPAFRRFVVARSLLLVTALSPPFVIALAANEATSSIRGLGPFVIASGVASFLGSPVWGRLADRSSRTVMLVASLAGGAIIISFLTLREALGIRAIWLTVLAYSLLAIAHTGARMGRKTYVVDMGTGDRRTTYVAVSNTIIGIVLLLSGVVSALAAAAGPEWTLAGLAAAGIAGAFVASGLPEVE